MLLFELLSLFPDGHVPFGREKIISKYDAVNAGNVADAFNAANSVHQRNAGVIDALYSYFRGETPILHKKKEYRKEVNNQVGVATAQEIVSFYVGYIYGEPKTYIRYDNSRDVEDRIVLLNNWCRMAGVPSSDIDLVTWALVCGTSYRSCGIEDEYPEETPFKAFSLDPRNTFVAYSRTDGSTPIFCATSRQTVNETTEWIVTTTKEYFVLENGEITASGENVLRTLPVIEYPANAMRIGVFEPVIPQLDALETIQSARVDATVQDVDNVLTVIGADPGDKDEEGNSIADLLRQLKMLVLPQGSDAKYITAPLRQADTQTLCDSLYSSILTITGVPNRNGGSSTSDTGAAVQLRDGWASAESHAKQLETCFKDAERRFLRAIMSIIRIMQMPTVAIGDIEIKFPRRYSENVLVRAQALKNLVDIGISLADALPMVSLCSDPLDVALRNQARVDAVLFGVITQEPEAEPETAENGEN